MYGNHKHGSQKCNSIGKYYRNTRLVSFSDLNCTSRTDFDFRNRTDSLHHRENSPLEDLVSIDMIRDFVCADSLHLLEQGVMKRCLNIWLTGKGSVEYNEKWSKSQKQNIDRLILYCNKELPSDIHRSIRSLNFITHWKATEFRTFLLYVGIIILKNSLADEVYEHFLLLFVAVRLSSNRFYSEKENVQNLTKILFEEYVAEYAWIYGEDAIVSNIHNLLHVPEDVIRFGNLNTISAYPFENLLHSIKRCVQPSKAALEQTVRRLAELSFNIDYVNEKTSEVTAFPLLKYEFENDCFKFIQLSVNVYLSTRKTGDRYFMNKDNKEINCRNAVREEM